jgi:3-(3-hydroxy-phenyl)propionate hydroxylase
MHMKKAPIIIVGGGPVGAVMALALHRREIPFVLLEAEADVVEDQRAATLHPPTLEMMNELGLLNTIREEGLFAPVFRHWDRVSRRLVAEFDMTRLRDETEFPYAIQFEQYKLVRLILSHLSGAHGCDVHFKTKVQRIDDSGSDVVRVFAERDADGKRESVVFEGAYVIGADGSSSIVRQEAGIDFQGFTYPERFVKIMTPYNFMDADSAFALRNFFSDPVEWINLFKVIDKGPPGLWRVVYPAPVGESDENALRADRIESTLQRFLPKKGAYEVCYLAIYRVHQRVAERFRKGRLLLVGDAAHLNNPIGGMGMNGGIHDAINLAEKLSVAYHQAGRDELLSLYDRQRRTVAVDYVQAQTIRNKKELEERDPAARQRILDEMSEMAADPARSLKHLMRISLLESVRSANAIGNPT